MGDLEITKNVIDVTMLELGIRKVINKLVLCIIVLLKYFKSKHYTSFYQIGFKLQLNKSDAALQQMRAYKTKNYR